MYLDESKVTIRGKTYTRYLLRESYRENGKVKHRTIANISRASPEEIEAIRLALRHKKDLQNLGTLRHDVTLQQGPSLGAVALVLEVAQRLGITAALGDSRQGKLALWQVIARVLHQGSWLAAVRLATHHAGCDLLDLKAFNEDDLYANLDWSAENQQDLEDRLFRWPRQAGDGQPPSVGRPLYLYDVTNAYLEGVCNELAAFGYNRDGKKGIRQIVLGLLCDEWGHPLFIEVFKGNTAGPQTVASQIRKLAERCGGGDVVLVGDRGMLKSRQVQGIQKHGFHTHSLSVAPLFIDLAGADGILGYAGGVDGGLDDNFHLAGASPTIDAGDPYSYYVREPGPNGARINQGADGNTANATVSPATQVRVLLPNGPEKFEVGEQVPIEWVHRSGPAAPRGPNQLRQRRHGRALAVQQLRHRNV